MFTIDHLEHIVIQKEVNTNHAQPFLSLRDFDRPHVLIVLYAVFVALLCFMYHEIFCKNTIFKDYKASALMIVTVYFIVHEFLNGLCIPIRSLCDRVVFAGCIPTGLLKSEGKSLSNIDAPIVRVSKISWGASLVAQWLRVCLLVQGTRVRALVWEDPTCHGAAGPVSHSC